MYQKMYNTQGKLINLIYKKFFNLHKTKFKSKLKLKQILIWFTDKKKIQF